MTKIIIKLQTETPTADAISVIKRFTDLGLSNIKDRIVKNRPICDFILFENNHDEVEVKLINLIEQLQLLKVQFKIYEIFENETLESLDEPEKYRITVKMLLNLFKSRKEDIEGFYDKSNE